MILDSEEQKNDLIVAIQSALIPSGPYHQVLPIVERVTKLLGEVEKAEIQELVK